MTVTKQKRVPTIPLPVRYEGHLACPRCRGRLFFDGDELMCVACGYEYDPLSAPAGSGVLLRG